MSERKSLDQNPMYENDPGAELPNPMYNQDMYKRPFYSMSNVPPETDSMSATQTDGDPEQGYTERDSREISTKRGEASGKKQADNIASDDSDMQPYAVAYMCEDELLSYTPGHDKAQTNDPSKIRKDPHNSTSSGGASGDDTNLQNIGDPAIAPCRDHIINPDALTPNPMYMYAPNARAFQLRFCGCSYRRVGVAVTTATVLALLILGGTLVGLYFRGGVQDVKKPTAALETGQPAVVETYTCQPVVDTTHTPGQPTLDTTCTYTAGQPTLDTSYAADQSVLNTTSTPGQPAVVTTYTLDQPTLDTTYTAGPVDDTYTCDQPTVHTTDTHGQPSCCSPERYKSTNGVSEETPSEDKIPESEGIVTFGSSGYGKGKFVAPYGVAVTADNKIVVADSITKQIQVFNMKGEFLRLFSAVVPGGNGPMQPSDVTVDGEGDLWVLGGTGCRWGAMGPTCNVTVVRYDIRGEKACARTMFHPRTTGGLRNGIARDARNDNIIVALSDEILIFLPNGTLFHSFKKVPEGDNSRVTINTVGNIFVTDVHGSEHSVHVYAYTGKFLFKFGKGQLKSPQGICMDNLGNIIVANFEHQRVDMFTSRGKFLRTVVHVEHPTGVALGPGGQLVVANSKDKITIFPRHVALE
ncbi:hypothetical protein Bbelb_310910 [Branchiostoma belcheri]|nr:hypothetical protein Bbelb_310910 [Branchiostoma belcheri]